MGFDELWDGFEKIKARTEDGEKFTAAVQKYLQKRHETEAKYARSLQHLSECFKIDLEIGSMLACWHGLRDETANLAESRQAFCDQIQELINTMTNSLKEDKKNRAMLVAKGNKYVSELAKTEDAMKKARAKYVDLRKKQDRSQEALQKAKSTGSSVNKLQKAAEKDEKKADKSDNEYRISVNALKVAQDKFHDTDMPALLREFEQHEERRLQVTREYFHTFGEKQNPLGPLWIESTDRFLSKVKEINIRSDLDLYVEKNRPDSDQPPPRAQYISYDGSVIQDVNGGTSSTFTSATSKNKKRSQNYPNYQAEEKRKKRRPTERNPRKKRPYPLQFLSAVPTLFHLFPLYLTVDILPMADLPLLPVLPVTMPLFRLLWQQAQERLPMATTDPLARMKNRMSLARHYLHRLNWLPFMLTKQPKRMN